MMPRWSPSIRLQLTMWYTAIFMVLLIIAGGLFYVILRTTLQASLDTDLHIRTQQVAAGISNESGAIVIHDITGELPDLGTGTPTDTSVAPPTIPSDINLGNLVRIVDAQNIAVYTSPAFRNLEPPPVTVQQPLHGTAWIGTITAPDGQEVRLYSAALTENGQIYGIIQVGQSLSSLNATLRHMAVILLVLLPLVLLVSTMGSYWLAGFAFLPIVRITQTAQAIEVGDLHRRVPVPSTHDEVYDLAQTFNAMIARLEAAFLQQRRFIADASHELRTPVAAIVSLTENALELHPHDDPTPVFQEVHGEAQRLRRIITELLSLAHADEGQLVLDDEPVRLDFLAADVVASLTSMAEEHGIILETGHLVPLSIRGDAPRLILVLMSLVDNALQYTKAGGRVTVSVHEQEYLAMIQVTDSGIGIGSEDLPHIFERFYRADPARSHAAGGSGLGLAIAHTIVTLHGGVLTVDSRIGEGTTCTMTFPASRSLA